MDENAPAKEESAAPAERVPRGYCWLPTLDVEPGMVLARPVVGGSGMRVSIQLATGSALTASTIAQLINKGVECVAVVQQDAPDPEVFAANVRRHEDRLHEIFGPAPNEHCRPLLDALLADGPCQC